VTPFIDGSGLVVAGKLFPFCFITIACGAISGFHTLISSGITPKIITRESHARSVGYGAMCLESLVAIMALIAACTLEPGVYLAMNVKGVGADAAAIAADTLAKVQAAGMPITHEEMTRLADAVGETSLYGRTGGAATLAVGMAQIFGRLTQGRWLDLWYHFAIMFEALFILTTLDAGTRVGRYLLQDFLGHLSPRLGHTHSLPANLFSSVLIVSGWGWFLIQGVRDPLGGINSLWPLFGIANQLLAAIALCLGTTILLKHSIRSGRGRALALVTLVPLLWLVGVTFTAGYQKMFNPSPRIGFLAGAQEFQRKAQAAMTREAAAPTDAERTAAAKAATTARRLEFNNRLDLFVTGGFLVMGTLVLGLSLREWVRLWVGRRVADLRETPIVWLPDSMLRERGSGMSAGSVAALSVALLRDWSGETAVDRELQHSQTCPVSTSGPRLLIDVPAVRADLGEAQRADAYCRAASRRFDGIHRCC